MINRMDEYGRFYRTLFAFKSERRPYQSRVVFGCDLAADEWFDLERYRNRSTGRCEYVLRFQTKGMQVREVKGDSLQSLYNQIHGITLFALIDIYQRAQKERQS